MRFPGALYAIDLLSLLQVALLSGVLQGDLPAKPRALFSSLLHGHRAGACPLERVLPLGQPGLSDPHVEGGTAQNKMEKLKKKKKEEKNICGVGDLRNIKGNRLNKGPSLCRRQAHSE